MTGSQDFEPDPRNETVLVYVNGELVPRREAVVSVFDAGFCLGDGVWEGFRVHGGQLPFADAHLDRLFWGARRDPARHRDDAGGAPRRAASETIAANGMVDGVHVRLMVTRGPKRTPTQDPRLALGKATVVIVAEWKGPRPEVVSGRPVALHLVGPLHAGGHVRHAAQLAQPTPPDPALLQAIERAPTRR